MRVAALDLSLYAALEVLTGIVGSRGSGMAICCEVLDHTSTETAAPLVEET